MRRLGVVHRRVLTRRLLGWGRGIYIVGMHRSGTSAITRTVNLMGIPVGDARDLIQDDLPSNPKGHWESRALVDMNDRVLAALGGTWSAPPVLVPGWERGSGMWELRREARRVFAETYATRRWVWKDPRLCLTLPFWRASTPARAVGVLVTRHPLEIAHSLETRNRYPVRYSLALWERYMRRALDGLVGLPVLVTAYDELLKDTVGWCARVGRFLTRHGFRVDTPDAGELASFVDPDLRHSAVSPSSLIDEQYATDSQRRLYEALASTAGSYESMPRIELPEEAPTTEAMLAEHRAVVMETGDQFRAPVV